MHSILRFEVEDRAITNWHDANAHLDELHKVDIASSGMVTRMRHSPNQSKIVKNYENSAVVLLIFQS